jgi:hypothetical protein
VEVRHAPEETAPRVLNAKATEVFGSPHYVSLDTTFRVVEDCRQNGWSKIRTAEPAEMMTSHRGWISSAALITEEEFSRVGYTEADFSFDAQTRPHRAMIVRAVNKIRQEDPRCKDHLSPGSVSLSRDRSKPREPVFFVTCGKGTGTVNVYFSQSDLAEGKTFAPPAHIDRSRAVDLCEAYANTTLAASALRVRS